MKAIIRKLNSDRTPKLGSLDTIVSREYKTRKGLDKFVLTHGAINNDAPWKVEIFYDASNLQRTPNKIMWLNMRYCNA